MLRSVAVFERICGRAVPRSPGSRWGGLKALSTHSRTGLREKGEGRKEHRGMGEKMGETRKGKAVVPHFLVLQNNCR